VVDAIKAPFEIIGEDVITQAEVQQATAKSAMEIGIKTAQAIDRPWNAVRVGLYYTAIPMSVPKPASFFTRKQYQKEGAPGFIQGLRDGWSGKEHKQWTDVGNVLVLGLEGERKFNQWVNRHPTLQVMETVRDFTTEVAIEGAAELALFGLVGAPVLRAVGTKIPLLPKTIAKVTPKGYVRVFGKNMIMPDPKVANKGLSPWLEAMMKRNLPTGISVDEALAWNMIRESPEEFIGTGLEKIRVAFRKVPTDVLFKGKELPSGLTVTPGFPSLSKVAGEVAQTKSLRRRLVDQFGDMQDTLMHNLDPAIDEADRVLRTLEDLPYVDPKKMDVAYDRFEKLHFRKEHLVEQMGNMRKKIGAADSKLLELQSLQAKDWTALSRTVRTEYLNQWRKGFVGSAKEFDDKLRYAANSVSAGRIARRLGLTAGQYNAMDVGEALSLLSDVELRSMTDYLDILVKGKESFQFQKYVQPVVRGKKLFKPKGVAARFFSFVPPAYNWATPAWQWYNRKGAKRVFQTFDSADTLATQMGIHYTDLWEETLETLGKNAAKDEDSMRRVFWAANGQFDKIDNAYKVAASEGNTALTKRIARERAAGEKINEMFDEMWEMLDTKGLIPPGVRKETYYIKNIIDKTVLEAAGKTVGKQAAEIGPMLRYYQKYAKEGIDIGEMINRVKHDLPVMENADAAFRSAMHNEIRKLVWEPAITEGKVLAEFTGDPEIVRYTADLINYAIRGQVTPLEETVEPAFKTLGKALEYGSRAIPGYSFKTQERAAKQILGGARRLTYHGALWMNPGPVVKNATQTLLNIPMTGYKSWWWGMRSVFTDAGQELANKHCRLLIGRVPLESFDIRTMKGFAEHGHKAFRFIDRVPNVKAGFNDACHWLINRNSDYIDTVRKYGVFRTGDINGSALTISKAFDAGELQHVKELANQMVKTAQYGYRKIDMPKYMIRGGPVMKSMLQFSTWPANYFYSYLPEIAKASFSGVGPGGIKLAMKERMALLKHYGNAIVLIEAGKAMGVDPFHVMPPTPQRGFPFVKSIQAPHGWGPAGEFAAGLFQAGLGGLNGNERAKNKGLARMERSITFAERFDVGLPAPLGIWYPSPLSFRRLKKVASGEKGLPHLLGFKELEQEEFTVPRQLRPQRPRR
jgi:hypothetical protein